MVFEAAVVPHEVTAVLAGERLALFGFFAEDRAILQRGATRRAMSRTAGRGFMTAGRTPTAESW